MEELLAAAREARANAHAPYSGVAVGAAIETASGAVFAGCNVENANYSNSLHAEEAALAGAVGAGHRSFARLAVASADALPPCGACRQSLREFDDGSLRVLLTDGTAVETHSLGELFPRPFGPESIGYGRPGDGADGDGSGDGSG